MSELWQAIQQWEQLINAIEAERRAQAALIGAIVGGIGGIEWPEPPDFENDAMNILESWVLQVKNLAAA